MSSVCHDKTLRSIADILGDVGSDLALKCRSLLLEGRHQEYLDSGFPDPSSPTFQSDYFAVEVASKYPYLDVDIDREAVALRKFHEIEAGLCTSDENIRRISKGWHSNRSLHAILHLARRKIEALLGEFHWECAEAGFSFGPGATVSLPRHKASTPNKFSNLKLTVTQSCLDLAVWAVCRNECWADYLASRYGRDPSGWFRLTAGNKVVTVPKNAKTDRTIAIEPDLNMFLQKGIGFMIRRRLKKVGVDLDNQSLNQTMAREASLSGDLATVDLSSASDSISLRLVEELLPPSWVDAIKASRSSRGVLPDGNLINYRKVSSMGNGYTFELESLIFWALARSCSEHHGSLDHRLAVYGDDIIYPISSLSPFLELLSACGFTPNSKKTHVTGFFRESCGKHYLKGDDVTPFYVKDRVDHTDRLYWLLNSISVLALRFGGGHFRDGRLKASWNRLLQDVPRVHRLFGPLFLNGQMSDICIGVSFDECVPRVRRNVNGIEGFFFQSRVRCEVPQVANSIGSLIGFLDRYGRFPLKARCELSRLPGRVKWRTSESFTPQWQEVGPWLTT